MLSDLAVIILNYFGFDDTKSCIESVKKSFFPTIFLVDNSADESERARLENSFKNDPGIKLLFPNENLGFASGVNLGLREALKNGYQKFLLINNDAILTPGAGKILATAFEDFPGSIITPTIIWDEKINKGNYYHKYLGLISSKPYFHGLGSIYYFTGCTLAFDRNFIETVGLMDESFFFYGDDIEFCYRAQKHNIKLVLLPDKLVQHAGSKTARNASFFYEYYLNRSHFLLIKKTIGNRLQQLLAYAGKFFVLGGRAFLRTLRYQSLVPLWAFFMGPLSLKVRPQKPN